MRDSSPIGRAEDRMQPEDCLYVFDACSLLNLVASRRFVDIARGTAARFVTSDLVAREVRYVRRGGGGADANEREKVDLGVFEGLGLLVVTQLQAPNELATFVAFAREMDDGEATACTIAVHRGATLVTDDRKARRIMAGQHPEVPLLTTAELIKAWAAGSKLDSGCLAHILLDIEERARFRPGRHDPLAQWWNGARRAPLP